MRSSYFLVGLGIAAIFFFAGFCFQSATQQGSVSMLPWLLDTYTCFTQFGALVLSAYAISCISSDYSGKTTQFYKELGFSSWSYYLVRVGALWFPLMLGSVVLTGLVCLMYGDWSPFVAMVVHYSAVSLFYVSLYGALGLIVGRFIVAYFTGAFLWVCATYFSSHYEELYFVAYFDQNSPSFTSLAANMASASSFGQAELLPALVCMAVALIAVLACSFISSLFERRWLRNGV